MKPVNPLGKNSFDKLESAGILGPKTNDPEQQKAKLEAKINSLERIADHLKKIQADLSKLYVVPKNKQLVQLTAAIKTTTAIHETKGLPQGVKSPITICLNELNSLREGVYTGAATDKKTLSLHACLKAQQMVDELIVQAKTRLQVIGAEFNIEDYFKRAADSIKNNEKEASKVESLVNKRFLVVRVPVVPADGFASVPKLATLGFKVEDIGGYPVIHNQLVIGLNPKMLLGDKAALMRGEKLTHELQSEVFSIKKHIEKALNKRVQLVSVKPYPHDGGVWYWLMTEQELKLFAKAFPTKSVKVSNWGFAFNPKSRA